jgi:hypothetical protein
MQNSEMLKKSHESYIKTPEFKKEATERLAYLKEL